MIRRRAPLPASATAPAPAPAGALVDELVGAGWVVPKAMTDGGAVHWTLIGTLASPTATAVDPAGLVVGEGWSLDWWIGGDDRWHLPAREAAVRQRLLEETPVVETAVRIPGGDAVARAYGIRSPRAVGDEWVVVEYTNATPVPLALALVIRPLVADGVGEASSITIESLGDGEARTASHLVRVDGRPAVLLPRGPARVAAGNRSTGDAASVVTNGDAGHDLVSASCPDGLATLAMIFPLAHTATLRVAIPIGEVGDEPLAFPAVVPDAATVAAGWDVHRRSPRIEVPEQRLAAAFAQARAHVLLAHDGEAVRRDGHRMGDLEPGATEVLLGALDLLDRPLDVGSVLARWTERLADPRPEVDALFLAAVSRHWTLHRADALLDWMLPEVAAAVERIGRAERKGRLQGIAVRDRTSLALEATARMLALAEQPAAAVQVRTLADRVGVVSGSPDPVSPLGHLLAADVAFRAGDPAGLDLLDGALAMISPTGSWPGPGPGGRPTGHDLVASAALVTAVRDLLVDDAGEDLVLLPVFPETWYGGGIEAHDLPTAHGRVSYAVRWHGTRPALLWELVPREGAGPVTVRMPSLDPSWSTTAERGDALLAEVEPPAGLDRVVVVSEHPDIDPEMRRPGSEPEQPAAPPPEGGSFS